MKKRQSASDIAVIAIFFAIMLVIHFLTSLVFNLWPVPIKPTLIQIPVIVASIMYGSRIGAILGGLKNLGVKHIISVSFGADITTWAYINYITKNKFLGGISQPCPAVVNYTRIMR